MRTTWPDARTIDCEVPAIKGRGGRSGRSVVKAASLTLRRPALCPDAPG